MDDLHTVDVRGLAHQQREQLIFPNIEKLAPGESLRLIVEFNPLPLVYMLKTRNEFTVTYEKEVPEEYILCIQRVKDEPDVKSQFKQIIKEYESGVPSGQVKEQAKQLFATVNAKTLTAMEQELMEEGVTPTEIRTSLCDIHLEILRDNLVKNKVVVNSPHPIHTLMEEHKIILNSLTELDTFITQFQSSTNIDQIKPSWDKLKDIAHHLVEAESHHQREEDVLFPRLAQHNIKEPGEIMRMDHQELRQRKQELFKLAHHPEQVDFTSLKNKIISAGDFITRELEKHIFKEDNILYQIALQVLTENEWQEVKKEADKIGYCCFTPADLK